MKTRFVYPIFALMLILSAPLVADRKPSQQKLDEQKTEKINQYLQEFYKLKQFNGTVLVAQKGKLLFEKGYGFANFEWDIPNTTDTKFRIASITKQFTAMLIMQYVQQGTITLNAPITKYLKEYRADTGNKMTIHHLLSHTAGLPNYLGLPEFRQQKSRLPYAVDEFVKKFCSEDLEFEPGTQFRYSNSGYFLLGQLIEKLSGKSYAAMLQEKIFKPLGMKNTGYDMMLPILKNRANGYENGFEGYTNAVFNDMSLPYAAGSLYSTTRDLMLWDAALYTEKLLSKKLIAKMYQPTAQRNYGYGWEIAYLTKADFGKKLTNISHGGMINGFNTNIARIIEDKILIILLNNTGGAPLPEMTDGIIKILNGKTVDMPKPRILNVLYSLIKDKGINAAIAKIDERKRQGKPISERGLNYSGYELLSLQRIKEAIAILKINVENNPQSANTHDSLAEAYLLDDNKKLALLHYEKALALDEKSDNAKQAIQRIKSSF